MIRQSERDNIAKELRQKNMLYTEIYIKKLEDEILMLIDRVERLEAIAFEKDLSNKLQGVQHDF